ncbi:MAG: nucleoside transporter C-terminal domain-containing protein [Burkholderiales bacterium]|nr:nucleoside transporter C-terminal domain-containing protein [Burkholderiales bacterium]
MGEAAHALAGIAGLIGLAWLASEARRRIAWRLVLSALALQLALALLLLKLPGVKEAFLALNDVLLALQSATRAGTAFVFGYLGGGALPFAESHAGASFILAFQALPIVLVMSALSALLFYWRVLPAVVRAISWLLERALGVGGVLGLAAAANIFVGMVEAPLLVRPWLARISRGELFALMAVGMATIAGTVLFLYASILGERVPGAVAHLLIASILSAPAAIAVAALMVPAEAAPTGGQVELKSEATSSVDAVTRGTLEGALLLINIVAMLVVFVALVTLANLLLGALPAVGGAPLTLERVLGWLLAPLAWLAGIPWAEARAAGALLGVKTVLNELVAYVQLSRDSVLSERSRLLLAYALCGFANFGSLGIMIGGLATMCPERRGEIVALGMRSIVAGLLATCLTAASVGLVI